jgi:GT2 family glycosyltransferase
LARHVASDIVALINDDVEVVPDWLDVLKLSVERNPHVGMVGLNCYVGVVRQDLVGANRLPLRVDYHEARLMDGGGKLISSLGPIFAFSKEAYDKVGGFDEGYKCFYEECDFGYALRRAGYYHYMASYPIVFHMGGATTSNPKNLDAAAEMERSRLFFEAKWGRSLSEIVNSLEPSGRSVVEWNTVLRNWGGW